MVLLAANIFGIGCSQAQPEHSDNIINILGIDPTAYPKIKVNIFVDELCAATGNLVKDDFTVEEDGTGVAIDNFYFTGKASGQMLDLAVVFDETDTMADEIRAMKSNVDDLTNKIKASDIDARYSLVTFKNEVMPKIEWTADPEVFKREVNQLRASGGYYQRPEDSLGGVAKALSFGFRPDAQKIIIVITDEPSMQRGDGWSNSTYHQDDVQLDLIDAGVMLVAVSPDFRSRSIPSNIPRSDLPLYADMRDLAQNSGGLWIDIYSADFSVILDQLEDIITGTYVIEYTSPTTTTSGSRTVSVSVNAPDGVEGIASSTYMAPAIAVAPNEPPIITALISDKMTPQEASSVITWAAEAADTDGDQILYRFFLDDEAMTDWTEDNTWKWEVSAEAGSYRIEAQVRDGLHAGPNGMDNRKSVIFEISEQNSPPIINDLLAEQDRATEITWTASATDTDGDQILYRFYLNSKYMTEWTSDDKWTLNTVDANVGENEVEIQIRDGKHKGPDDYDDAKSIQFKLSSIKLMVKTWEKTLGEGAAKSVQQTSDGYIIAGDGSNNGAWLAKTDTNGNVLWYETYGGLSLKEVQQTKEGGYIAAGTNRHGACLIKTDGNGKKLWDRTFGGKGSAGLDDLQSVKQTNDNGYVLAGFTFTLAEFGDVWLIKTNANGDELWNKTFGGSDLDWALSVLQTSDGGYILSGFTESFGRPSELDLEGRVRSIELMRMTWLIKTDYVGNKEWDRILPGISGDKIRLTSDGGYIVGGGPMSSLIKTDSIGHMEWFKFSNSLYALDVQQTSDGGYIINDGNVLIKTDSMGNEQWRNTFSDYPNAKWNSFLQASDGGYILAGENNGYACLLKTDVNGNI
jgi:hypothetical protein